MGREQNIKDYIALANQLVWQRQGSFFAAAVLAAIYFDALTIFAFYAVVVVTEVLDVLLGRQSKTWDGKDPVRGRRIFIRIAINTDAHSIGGLDHLPYGIGIGRKGWLRAEDVPNTLDVEAIAAWFER